MLKLMNKEQREESFDKIRYKVERLRYNGPELVGAEVAARVTRKFPRAAYWVAVAVGARNIQDDEVVFDVSYMDVLNRQFMKTRAFK